MKFENKNTVWKFTNQRELNKSEFINYFERKIFRTIRKHKMLPEKKTFTLKKSEGLNTKVLKSVLEKKFQVQLTHSSHLITHSSNNLSDEAENIFKKITKGNFKNLNPKNAPLINLSDEEIKLYAKLKNIKGKAPKRNKKIQDLFKKFLPKNPDLEINILKAQGQINGKK